jgi:hypothetical protein
VAPDGSDDIETTNTNYVISTDFAAVTFVCTSTSPNNWAIV